ncbi:dystroglycan-like [Dorcoceras hygrometricum]|uniref:Dystroglycan-like n=1 Tax=Dorcoceras hygrometricum TaxID=472368 RepID=A0A2Z7A9Q8_9LAMI|nr:dystroglycan-like [Dorcoceras hygrometricum]
MASSLYSNSQHVDFDSVLAMDDQGMVSMFQGLMASSLTGFLGWPTVIYEDALLDFFENASVCDGHVDFDSVLAMDDQGMVSMFQGLMASSLTGFLGWPTVIYEDALLDFFENASVCDGVIISTVAGQLVEISEEWFAESFDLPLGGLGDLSAIPKDVIFDSRSIVSLSGEPVSLSGGKNQTKIEFRLLCDIMAKAISVKAGSFNAITVEKFSLMTTIAILVEKDSIKGNPAQEHYFLINADIDLLVDLRAKVIDEVAQFFNSFSLKKLATINIEEMYKKEEQVLSWGETESPQLAIQRKLYILLKYREVLVWKFLDSWKSNFVPGQGSSAIDLSVIDLLSDLHLFFLEELTKEARAHGLSWKKPCCSRVFEGKIRDRGAVIARSNTSTRSSCWRRTMLKVDGAWIVEPCADRWVKIPWQILSCDVHRQRQYGESLPPVNNFFKTLTKRWADICLEVVEFCASKRLLPVGSLQFCRSLSLVEPVFRVAPSQSPVFALRVSQFCSVFVDFSVFSWLPTADITYFLSSIALNRTVFISAQISQNTVSVAPSVQLSLDQRQSSSTSADSSSSLNFDATDLDAPVSSLPTVSIDFFAALADLHAILLAHIDESQTRQEARTIDEVQTLRFNDFRKNVLAQNASIFTGLADVRKEVQEVNAKVDILASRLNDVQKNVEETKEALCHQLLEFQSQSQANQNILNAQLSEHVNYINRGGADKKGESSSRGPQQPDAQISASAERTPSLAQRIEMAQRRILQTVLDDDSNRESLERQAAAERDRE